ncbi:hypothetical protein [Henriciella pelagia]|jgi:hypothetical protein|uniref:Uncharacterized protein n=1 Tax=Henriciella pelagia TaxID=1977912 RepID=A0ABQ1JKL2_9PROT|nr:hypothetical protein [Henriciella pelagia]GGB68843.1 hypothetical protein GCM10011503_16820 [Henriciella pelagia]
MKGLLLPAIVTALCALAGCNLFGAPADLPLVIDEAYLTREGGKMEPQDSCGPEFVQERFPGVLRAVIDPLADGPFRPACRRHDACYRLREKDQAWCDDRFRAEMVSTCDSGTGGLGYSIPRLGPSLCRFHASLYFNMVNSTNGASAYEGMPGGVIANLRHQIIRRTRGEDEVKVCLDVHNPTVMMQGYDAVLHDEAGTVIDRQPGRGQLKLRVGERGTICVSTEADRRYGLRDVGDGIYVSLRADDPEVYAFRGDMVVVDMMQVVLD